MKMLIYYQEIAEVKIKKMEDEDITRSPLDKFIM